MQAVINRIFTMDHHAAACIDPSLVIDRLGGTTAVAKLCDIKPPSVHEWRAKGIPKSRLQFLLIAHPEAFAPAPVASGQQITEQVAA